MEELDFCEFKIDKRHSELDLPVFMIDNQEAADLFFETKRYRIIPLMFSAVYSALKEKLLRIPVFKILHIDGAAYTVVIHRDQFDHTLQLCIDYFTETEEYEKCSIALKLIKDEGYEIHAKHGIND